MSLLSMSVFLGTHRPRARRDGFWGEQWAPKDFKKGIHQRFYRDFIGSYKRFIGYSHDIVDIIGKITGPFFWGGGIRKRKHVTALAPRFAAVSNQGCHACRSCSDIAVWDLMGIYLNIP